MTGYPLLPPSLSLLLFFVCLEFLIIRFVISTSMPIFFIKISFVLPPPPLLANMIMEPVCEMSRVRTEVEGKTIDT